VIAGSIATCAVAMLQNANYFATLTMIADRRCMKIAQPAPTISEPLTVDHRLRSGSQLHSTPPESSSSSGSAGVTAG